MSTPPRQNGSSSHPPPDTPGWSQQIFGLFSARKSSRVESGTESTLLSAREGSNSNLHPLHGRPPRAQSTQRQIDLMSPSYNSVLNGTHRGHEMEAEDVETQGMLVPKASFGSPTFLPEKKQPVLREQSSFSQHGNAPSSASTDDAYTGGFAVSLAPTSSSRKGNSHGSTIAGRSRPRQFQQFNSIIRSPLRAEPLNLQEQRKRKKFRPGGFLSVEIKHRSSSRMSNTVSSVSVEAVENYFSKHSGSNRTAVDVNYPTFKPGKDRTKRSRLPLSTDERNEIHVKAEEEEMSVITVTEQPMKRRRVQFGYNAIDNVATPSIKSAGNEYGNSGKRKATPYKAAPASPTDGGNDDDDDNDDVDDDGIRSDGGNFDDRDLPEMPEQDDVVDSNFTNWSNLSGSEVSGPPTAGSITLPENFIGSLPTPEPNFRTRKGARFQESEITRPSLSSGNQGMSETHSSKKTKDDADGAPKEVLGWGDLFKEQNDMILCQNCSTWNPKGTIKCLACTQNVDGVEPASDAQGSTVDGGISSSTITAPPKVAGSIGSSGFSFGGSSTGINPAATSASIGASGFSFPTGVSGSGSSVPGGFSFGGATVSASAQPSQPSSFNFSFGRSDAGSTTTKTTVGAPIFGTPTLSNAPGPASSSGIVFGTGGGTQQNANDVGASKSSGPGIGASSFSNETKPTGGLFGSNTFGQGKTSSSNLQTESKTPATEPSFKRSRAGDESDKGSGCSSGDDSKPVLPATQPFPSLVSTINSSQPAFSFPTSKDRTDVPRTQPTFVFGGDKNSSLPPKSSTDAPTLPSSSLPLFGTTSAPMAQSTTFTFSSSQVDSDATTPAPTQFSFAAPKSTQTSAVQFGQAQSSDCAPTLSLFGTSAKPVNTSSATSGNSSLPSLGSSMTPGPFGDSLSSGPSFTAAPSSDAAPAPFGSTPGQAPAFGSVSSSAPMFGSTPASTAGGSFGSASTVPAFGSTPALAPFGSTPGPESSSFGSTSAAPAFGSAAPAPFVFGSVPAAPAPMGSTTSNSAAPGLFGSTAATSTAPGPFGSTTAISAAPAPFGSTIANSAAPFGASVYVPAPTFGSTPVPQPQSAGLFGSQPPSGPNGFTMAPSGGGAQTPGQFGGFGQPPAMAPGQLNNSGFGGTPAAPINIEAGFNLGTGGGTTRRTPGTGGRRIVKARRPNGSRPA
jgi:hypothetical protein